MAKTSDPTKLKARFVRSKETNGTYVFTEADKSYVAIPKGGEVVIGTIYLKKSAYPAGKGPTRLLVTVTDKS